jgi:hypothetical protein
MKGLTGHLNTKTKQVALCQQKIDFYCVSFFDIWTEQFVTNFKSFSILVLHCKNVLYI